MGVKERSETYSDVRRDDAYAPERLSEQAKKGEAAVAKVRSNSWHARKKMGGRSTPQMPARRQGIFQQPFKPFQTSPWEPHIRGRPNRRGAFQRGYSEECCCQDRRFQDHRYSHILCISIFPSQSPIRKNAKTWSRGTGFLTPCAVLCGFISGLHRRKVFRGNTCACSPPESERRKASSNFHPGSFH